MKKIIAIVIILASSLFYQISNDQVKLIKELSLTLRELATVKTENTKLKKLLLKEDFNQQ